MLKATICSWLLWIGAMGLFAQTTNNDFTTSDYFSNFIPGAPKQGSLGSFGNYPVNYYTGLPEISLELMTLRGRDLTLPVSINYDATGVKLDDISGTVGLKFNLSAGGFVSRNVNGLPDEMPGKGYWVSENYINGATIDGSSMANASEKFDIDYEPDEFVAYLPGRAIKFFIRNRVVVPSPRQHVLITYTLSNNKLNRFDVVTEDGMKYTFGVVANAIEETKVENLNIRLNFLYNYRSDTHRYDQDNWTDHKRSFYKFYLGDTLEIYRYQLTEKSYPFYNSKWYLVAMKSPSGDEITFNYANLGYQKYVSQPSVIRKKPILTNVANYTYTVNKCVQNYWFLGCTKREDITWTHADWKTPAYTRFTSRCPDYDLNCAGSAPQEVAATQTASFFDPTETPNENQIQINPDNLFVNQSLITESVIKLTSINSATGKINFSTSGRLDLPGGIKYDRMDLLDANNVAINSVRFSYTNVVSEVKDHDYLWISEAILLDRLSEPLFQHTYAAYDVKNMYTEAAFNSTVGSGNVNGLAVKYMFEGLKPYNFTRLYLDKVEEVAGEASLLRYEFTYIDRARLRRRLTPMQNVIGFTRLTNRLPSDKPFKLYRDAKAKISNAMFPSEGREIADGESGAIDATLGMLKEISYPTGGKTVFAYSNSPSLYWIEQIDSDGKMLTHKDFEYAKVQFTKATLLSYQNEAFMDGFRKFEVVSSAPQNRSFAFSQGVAFPNKEAKAYNGPKNTNQGYEHFFFTTDEDILTPVYSYPKEVDAAGKVLDNVSSEWIFPFPKKLSQENRRGLLTKHLIYDSKKKLVKATHHVWEINQAGYQPVTILGFSGGSLPWGDATKYRWARYPITADWITQKSMKEISYDPAAPDTSVNIAVNTEYFYDSRYLQVVKTKKYNRRDRIQSMVSETKYVTHDDYDFPKPGTCEAERRDCISECTERSGCHAACDSAYENCIDGADATPDTKALITLRKTHQIGTPVETRSFTEDSGELKLLSAVIFKYVKDGDKAMPREVLALSQSIASANYQGSRVNTNGSFTADSRARTVHRFDSYDATGNLLQQTTLDGRVAAYQWDTKSNLVASFITNPGISQQKCNYSYYPSGMVKSISDQNDRNQFFEYDNFSRLRLVRDHDNNIVSRYRYHYSTQQGFSSDINISGNLYAGESLYISSADPNVSNSPSTYVFDYGDNTPKYTGYPGGRHTYAAPGNYMITLEKSNVEFPTQTFTRSITIAATPVPVICADGPTHVDVCGTRSPEYGACTQPANRLPTAQTTLTANVLGGCRSGIFTYNWEFKKDNDGWVSMGSGKTVPPPSEFVRRTIGLYSIRCRVTDQCGKQVVVEIQLTIYKSC